MSGTFRKCPTQHWWGTGRAFETVLNLPGVFCQWFFEIDTIILLILLQMRKLKPRRACVQSQEKSLWLRTTVAMEFPELQAAVITGWMDIQKRKQSSWQGYRGGAGSLFQDEYETKWAVRAFHPQRPSSHSSASHFGKGKQRRTSTLEKLILESILTVGVWKDG